MTDKAANMLRYVLISFSLLAFAFVNAQNTYESQELRVGFKSADGFNVVLDDVESWDLASNDERFFVSVTLRINEDLKREYLEEETYWNGVDLFFGDGLTNTEVTCLEIDSFDVCYVIGNIEFGIYGFNLIGLMMKKEMTDGQHLQVAISFNEGDRKGAAEILKHFYSKTDQ